MAEPDYEEIDYPAAYEALIEFLYLAPVGIVKFRPDGTIEMANPTAAQLLMPLAPSGDMSDLYQLLFEVAPDLREHIERFEDPAGQIFDQVELTIPKTAMTLMLDINKINDQTMMAVLQNVSDLTNAKRQILQETESQRLLSSVFMRINSPVVVIRADGFILLANSAFQQLLGYDAKGLAGLNIDALLPPEATGAARAARSQQMLDGTSYQIEVAVTSKMGFSFKVLMNSAILQENSKQLRVITLLSGTMAAPNQPVQPIAFRNMGDKISQVRAIDMSDIVAAVGADWQSIGPGAMELCEQIIRPLLSPFDVLKRGRVSSFVIWFAEGNPTRCATIVARAMELIMRVFETNFGAEIARRVGTAAAVV